MATIYAVYNSDGCVGRCDARCYDAKGPDCNCICGGANHGVGEKIAREDCSELSDDELKADLQGLYGFGPLRVFRQLDQLLLFG